MPDFTTPRAIAKSEFGEQRFLFGAGDFPVTA